MKSFSAAVLGVMLMAGCAQQAPGFDGSYTLADIDGAAIPGSATLVIAGDQISGQGPCNAYHGQNRAAWPAVDLSAIAMTRRACITEGGEGAFHAALGQVTAAERSGDTLVLTGPGHSLRFTAD
ncbi:META domain-containing protein [Paracoccus xiamenensis]|uniref:META domain-containing protein n=1 Tax=Paracoccus xiamenensis TaxID=2714901 RepID=UPI00140DA67C|nr:META domain-containing protein [Paracoccus xiamenensis]NHF74729.1 META domain-containing protein [Paracoccus xiamenensis]